MLAILKWYRKYNTVITIINLLLLLLLLLLLFLDPGTQFPGRKKLCYAKKKCQAEMVIAPPSPPLRSWNCRAVKQH